MKGVFGAFAHRLLNSLLQKRIPPARQPLPSAECYFGKDGQKITSLSLLFVGFSFSVMEPESFLL